MCAKQFEKQLYFMRSIHVGKALILSLCTISNLTTPPATTIPPPSANKQEEEEESGQNNGQQEN